MKSFDAWFSRNSHRSEAGVVLSNGGRVYEFDIGYDRMREGGDNAVIEHWHDITSCWQAHPFHSEIADAFIWRPPARRTYLVLSKGVSRLGNPSRAAGG